MSRELWRRIEQIEARLSPPDPTKPGDPVSKFAQIVGIDSLPDRWEHHDPTALALAANEIVIRADEQIQQIRIEAEQTDPADDLTEHLTMLAEHLHAQRMIRDLAIGVRTLAARDVGNRTAEPSERTPRDPARMSLAELCAVALDYELRNERNTP